MKTWRPLLILLHLGLGACEPSRGPTSSSSDVSSDGEPTAATGGTSTSATDTAADSTTAAGGPLRWYTTCGDPVCGGYSGPHGLPQCSAEQTPGGPCDVEGKACDLVTECNTLLVCADKDPKLSPNGCPISRARFKTDIEYVGAADLQRYADELRGLRLATYRYRQSPASARRRLGIILEDDERGIWVDPHNDRVDLYGYASLAVAALQVQQRRLEELEAEVERLSTRLAPGGVCEH